MCLAFGVVLFLLCKFGFPIILRSIEERKEYIDSSLEEAGKARQETMHLKEQGRQVMEEAQAQRWKILEDTRAEQEQVAQQYAREAAAKQERLQAINQEKLRLEGARQKCDRGYKSMQEELQNLLLECSRLENKKTQMEATEDNILQKMWESYELTRVTAQELRRRQREGLPISGRLTPLARDILEGKEI